MDKATKQLYIISISYIFAASIKQNTYIMLIKSVKNDSKPVCIVHAAKSLYTKINFNINKFHSEEENSYQFHHVDINTSIDDIIAQLVELYNEKRNVLFISSSPESLRAVLQTIRYHNKLTIVHHIDESPHFLDNYYKPSNDLSNQLSESIFKNIVRIDFSAIQQHQFSNSFSHHILNTFSRVFRLGQIKDNLYLCEPAIRSADVVNFNMNALKYSEFPSIEGFSQSGLTSEEACMLARHIGISQYNRITLINGITEQNTLSDDQSANVLAQLIWYYYQGLNNRYEESMEDPQKRTSYNIYVDSDLGQFEFLKSELSGRWWYKAPMEMPDHLSQYQFYPCHYEDYLNAAEGDIPDEIFQALDWYNELLTIKPS